MNCRVLSKHPSSPRLAAGKSPVGDTSFSSGGDTLLGNAVYSVVQENGYHSQLLRGHPSIQSLLKENVRFVWFRKSRNQPIQYGPGNCGKPLPICMDLICKGCPSRCLESQKPQKKICKEKSLEDQLTWWEKIFGPSSKRFWPDPCTCRLVHREKKEMRAQDPRLRDSRYKMTAGDVFLYTEMVKQNRRGCMEPQPKPPPSYRVPKAALIKMISNMQDDERISRVDFSKDASVCKKGTPLMAYKIPFEEMRPPERRRKSFFCYEGVLPEDVPPPMNRDLNCCRTYQKQVNQQGNLVKNLDNSEQSQIKACEDEIDTNQIFNKLSRVERLKILVKQSETTQCIKSFS